MLNSKPISKLIYLDIETIPATKSFYDMTPAKQELFLKRFKKDAETMMGLPMDEWSQRAVDDNNFYSKEKFEEFYNNRAPLHAEFCQIVCISIGWFDKKTPTDLTTLPEDYEFKFKTKSFAGTDEKKLLTEFYQSGKSVFDKGFAHDFHLVAFNGNTFDFPMIGKKFLLNFMPLPPFFNVDGVKPWDLEHWVDLKVFWKWNVFDGNASLPLLCECFAVPTSKDDISGKDVRDVYYNTGDVERIAVYCNKDVYSTAVLHLRMKGLKHNVLHS